MTQYKQNVWAYSRADGCVLGSIFVDTDRNQTNLTIHDAWTLDPLFIAEVPWGSLLPSRISTSITTPMIKAPIPFVQTPTVTASPFVYKNTDNRPQLVTISGGTVSAIARSRGDNATYVAIPSTSGEFIVPPGDFLKITYTSAPTVTVTPM